MSKLAIHNPANGEKIAELAADDAASVAAKTARARAAQASWAVTPLSERKACIDRFQDGVVREREALAAVMTRETGKPIRMSRNELDGLIGRLDFFVAMVEPVTAVETVYNEAGMNERIEHLPLGVIGNISAWNYPWFVGCNVIIPALLTGNAVLYKPSEFATLTGLEIARLLHEAGVPHDVFVPLVGAGAVGAALLEQKIDGLFFTGSYATGVRIAQTVGPRFMKLQLELGGKDPSYVCDDADPAAAAASLADGAMYNSGQSCCSVERIYVHERIHDAFVAAFVAAVKGFKIGDPMSEDTYIGAITRPAQLDVLDAHVADAKAKGAHVAHRRASPDRAGQLVRADGVQRSEPRHGADEGRKFRAHHRHPESRRRRRGRDPDERLALRPDGRRLHARWRAGPGLAGPRQRRQPVLELLRPRQPAPAVERLRRFGRRPDAVHLWHPDLHAAARLAPEDAAG